MKMHVASPGHAVFALTFIGLGILSLIKGDLVAVWDGVPKAWAVREPLAYVTALVSLGCGLGLFWQRTATAAARVLLGSLLAWMLLIKLRFIFTAPLNEISYQTNGVTAVYVAGAWVFYAGLAGDWDRRQLAFAVGERGVRIARLLYGLAMIGFGFSHFAFLKNTYSLVPDWLPWHLGWAYFTGISYLAAAVGILFGVFPRLATLLAALQIAGFTFLVWPPLMLAGTITPFQWNEFTASWTLTAAGWLVVESYRGSPWLGLWIPWLAKGPTG